MRYMLTILTCWLVTTPAALAGEYHVSPAGDDGQSGSSSRPFKTIERGLRELKPGDTLLIHEGRYDPFTVRDLRGSAEAPITIKAPPKARAVIDRYPNGGVHAIHLLGTCRHLVFENLEITDSDPRIDEYRALDLSKDEDVARWKGIAAELAKDEQQRHRSGVRINPPASSPQPDRDHAHLVFRRLVVHRLMGLGFTGRGDDMQFIDNHVYDLGYPASGYGWYLSGNRHVLRGNRIENCNYGMHLYTETRNDAVNETLVENNIVRDSGRMFFHASSQKVHEGGVGVLLRAPGGRNVIRNNVVVDGYVGISLGSTRTLVAHNTVVNFRRGIYVLGKAEVAEHGNVIRNNIVYSATLEAITVTENQGQTVDHNLVGVDPRFVAAGRDFRPRADSPAIDAGAELKEVPTDLAGIARPQGKAWDIGAYEYYVGSAPQTAPAQTQTAPAP